MSASGRPTSRRCPHYVDVAILGGGPAGTATALALRNADPKLDVLVVERSRYETERIGETLPPDAGPLLRRLGVWDAFLADGHLPAYGSRSVWGDEEPYDHEFLFHARGTGWHLDRRRFDRMLADAASCAGADVRVAHRLGDAHRTGDGRWRLSLSGPRADPVTVCAALVVDATGRRAGFARKQGAISHRFDALVGIVVTGPIRPGGEPIDSYTFVEAFEGGWWYSSKLPGGRWIAACMTDGDLASRERLADPVRLAGLLRQAPRTERRLGDLQPLGSPGIHPAWSHRLDRFSGDGWLAVGDAASTFDPLSSQGIVKALRCGILAASAIHEHRAGSATALRSYDRLLAREYRDFLEIWLAFYHQEGRWPGAPFWDRRRFSLTLDPRAVLSAGGPIRLSAPQRPALLLAAQDLEAIRALCLTPRPAHEVVTAFRASLVDPPSDWVTIVAIQALLEQGALRSGPEVTPTGPRQGPLEASGWRGDDPPG